MASAAASLSVSPEPLQCELICCDWTMEKNINDLKDELMEDVPGQLVTAGSTSAVTTQMVYAPTIG